LGDFAHDGARDELVLIRGRHEERLDIGQQVAVHAGHLEFVLEVGHGAQAAHDDGGVLFAHKVLQQARKAPDLHVGVVAQDFFGDFHALVDGEEGFFVAAVRDADDDLVEQACGTAYQIFVAPGERVESARVDGSDHGKAPRLMR